MASLKPVISLRLDPDVDAVVRAMARERRLPVSAFVQWVLADALKIAAPAAESGDTSVAPSPAIAASRASGAVVKKQGRNEECACGSGLKYKRCCGATSAVR